MQTPGFPGRAQVGGEDEKVPTSKGTTKADASSGAWSVHLSGVSDGAHTYFAKAKDAEGNTSPASNSVTVRVDKTAPKLSEVYPLSGATEVLRNTDIAAGFTEEMNPATFTPSTVTLVKDGTTTPIGIRMGLLDSYPSKLWISPWSDDGPVALDSNTKYTLKIKGGTSGMKDLVGNALEQDYSWSFATEGAPPSVVGYTPTQTSDVPRSIRPTATFSVNMDPSTITASNIKFEVYDTKRRRWVSVTHRELRCD
jgi:Bacterial Ig-like domain